MWPAAVRYLQLNRNRLQRVRRALEIPGIAWWTGLPSVIHHGTGGSHAGAAGRAVPVVSGGDREVAEHDQGVCPRSEGLDDVSGPSRRRLADSEAGRRCRVRRLAAVAATGPRRLGGGAADGRTALLGGQCEPETVGGDVVLRVPCPSRCRAVGAADHLAADDRARPGCGDVVSAVPASSVQTRW